MYFTRVVGPASSLTIHHLPGGVKDLDQRLGKSLMKKAPSTWMSQEVSKWLVNGLKPTYCNGVYWGYKPIY